MFRRDRYTWFFTFLMAATLIMALGKYTFVYRFMFEHLPAFSKFRVPKMILFLFAFGAAVLAGRGIDLLAEGTAERKKLAWWVGWCGGLVALVGLLWVGIRTGGQTVAELMGEYIAAPTRYQSGDQLIDERYGFMLREGAIAFAIGCALPGRSFSPGSGNGCRRKVLLPFLVILLLGDLWRVNDQFFVVTAPPQANRKAAKNDIVQFLEPRIDHYRMQPLNDENAHYYADNGFANISAYVTISERRYKEFLDSLHPYQRHAGHHEPEIPRHARGRVRSPEGGAVRQVCAGLHLVQRVGGAGEQDRPAEGVARPFRGGGDRSAAAARHHECGSQLQSRHGCPGRESRRRCRWPPTARWPARELPGWISMRRTGSR